MPQRIRNNCWFAKLSEIAIIYDKKFSSITSSNFKQRVKKTFKGFQVYNCESHSHHQVTFFTQRGVFHKKMPQLVDIE